MELLMAARRSASLFAGGIYMILRPNLIRMVMGFGLLLERRQPAADRVRRLLAAQRRRRSSPTPRAVDGADGSAAARHHPDRDRHQLRGRRAASSPSATCVYRDYGTDDPESSSTRGVTRVNQLIPVLLVPFLTAIALALLNGPAAARAGGERSRRASGSRPSSSGCSPTSTSTASRPSMVGGYAGAVRHRVRRRPARLHHALPLDVGRHGGARSTPSRRVEPRAAATTSSTRSSRCCCSA